MPRPEPSIPLAPGLSITAHGRLTRPGQDERPKTIALPGPFVDWLEGTDAFTNKTRDLLDLQMAVENGRRRTHGPVGYTLTIDVDRFVTEELEQAAGEYARTVVRGPDSSTPERRALATLRTRMKELG